MDPNLTGRDRPTDAARRPLEERLAAGLPSAADTESTPAAATGSRGRVVAGRSTVVVAALAVLALAAAVAFGGTGFLTGASASASPAASPIAAASTSGAATPLVGPSESSVATASPTPSPGPTPAPTAPPLPALLAAIGDSYSQAWSVSPSYPRDHTQFSWVIGTDKSVNSLLRRFQALGAEPIVVDAATSGRTMADAPRQAQIVVAAASKLAAGRTAYVTFELGTNDLCASPNPMTAPADFEAQLRAAVATLRAGLPAGSRILMLSVPDFPHFRDITQASPAAKANLAEPANLDRCAPYLGRSSPAAIAAGDQFLTAYDASLEAACADIESHEGATGRLRCTYNPALLAESDFTIADLSTADYFHPSLSGQNKMAGNAWLAGEWAPPTP